MRLQVCAVGIATIRESAKSFAGLLRQSLLMEWRGPTAGFTTKLKPAPRAERLSRLMNDLADQDSVCNLRSWREMPCTRHGRVSDVRFLRERGSYAGWESEMVSCSHLAEKRAASLSAPAVARLQNAFSADYKDRPPCQATSDSPGSALPALFVRYP